MNNATRVLLNAYMADQATLNGVPSVAQKFAVAPTIQQRLESRIQENSDFLKSINIVPVDEMQGEKLGLGTDGPVASRTDTNQKDRETRDVAALDGRGYECKKTDYDTHVKYAKLDMWAKFPDFQLRLARAIQRQCALDRIMIGFNGVQAAANTNRQTAPLLQDVNKGWLQNLRDQAAARVMASGKTAGKVAVGANGDYKTLDGLVYDAYKSLLDPWHAEAGDIVAIVGRGLMHDKLFPLVDGQKAPTEVLAADIVRSQMRLGSLPAITVPYVPEHSVLITSLDNLSIYYQAGARRRAVIDNPKRDRIETFESSNDAFVIEDLGKACLVENIEIVEA
ncbi:phage major capsid protein, P2 family [Acidovorax sp. GBBC 3332]|nr:MULTISPECIES: phage major capsid protein, P2 family [unclassified Acidovorax]MDA8448502.1 phage major capsid protein, P2 family [Acidovorax sp. GBBC 3297]MDA8457531.1 phage major capsid protein, P2 family [Acidovorax sp. GBBC 3333]MDA8462945.1 phage major capsid protein, P2 family [Acidovorax sp. GBBC 3332]MDA8467601.1 phage major capsid protein, P2 family [Acidovorax sp. GBBC 3299]